MKSCGFLVLLVFEQNQVGSSGSFCSWEASLHPQDGALPGPPTLSQPPSFQILGKTDPAWCGLSAGHRAGSLCTLSGRSSPPLRVCMVLSVPPPTPHLPALLFCLPRLPSAPLGCPERAAGITPGLVWIITAQPWAQLGHQGSQDTELAWPNSSESCLKVPIGFKVEYVCFIWKM